jgi:hypothetical protein
MAATRFRILPVLAGVLAACAGPAVQPSAAPSPGPTDWPGLTHIREAELREDLFALGGDAMRGREAGTLDELRASMWLAERARAAGLEPGGDDGTYFQFFPLHRVRQSVTSRVVIGNDTLIPGRDVAITQLSDATIDAPIVWVDAATEADLARADLTGKVAAARITPAPNTNTSGVSLAAWRYANTAVNRLNMLLRGRGAVAVIIVADELADGGFERIASTGLRGRFFIDGHGGRGQITQTPTFFLRSSQRAALSRADQRLRARLSLDSFDFPSVNVVARVPGTDARLRNEFVLFSSHQDHDGVRAAVNGDSIWNGADDNATTSVALLAIGRAFAANPGRRSALFIWHGAEEKGLYGSYWHVDHPLVPRESIVAVLNGDMLGRNHPDTAALLGVIPPHRSSADLVRMALEANERVTRFVVDSSWDRTTHREGWFFRSDHLPYARASIPALFFSSLLHAEYHTPADESASIDTRKLWRITQWLYATGWLAANSPERPRLEPGFRLER